jgi:hypothetical protein
MMSRWLFAILFGLLAGGVIAGGAWMIWHLNASLRSQGGDFYIGRKLLVAVVLTTVAGVGIAIWLMLRKQGTSEISEEGVLRALDATDHTLGRVLQILLGVAAGGVLAGGIWMITHMDASSRTQAGALFVGIGMLVALACIAGMYISIEMRLRK